MIFVCRAGQNTCIFIRTCFIVFFFYSFSLLSSAAAQVTAEEPCKAYLDNLDEKITHISQEDFNKCNVHEQVIISAESWTNFVLRYKEHLRDGALPIRLFQMFAMASREGGSKYAKAFSRADRALSMIFEITVKLDDTERALFYSSLIIEWRNELLVKAGLPEEFTTELAGFYEPSYSKYNDFIDIDRETLITCAIRYDSFVLPLADFLKSNTFNQCLEE